MKNFTLPRGWLMLAALVCFGVGAMIADTSYAASIDWAAIGSLTLANGLAAIPISDQIKSFEAKRVKKLEEMDAIWKAPTEEGRTLDASEKEAAKGIKADIAEIDEHLPMLREREQLELSKATPVTPAAGTQIDRPAAGGVEIRGPMHVERNLPPGIRFTRFAMAMAQAKGNVMLAREIAKTYYRDTPEIENCLNAATSMGGTKYLTLVNEHPLAIHQKTAVTAVSGTDTAVAQYTDIQTDFIELLRPKLIIGRMQQLTRVPFLSRLGRQLTGVTGSFVGEGAPKPVQKQTYDAPTLGYAKVAVIVVLSDEAARFGTIQVEMRARDDMLKGIATYIDKRFMDPAYSGVANVSPASITNSARRVQASGTTLAAIDTDVRNVFGEFATSDVDPTTAVWVMGGGVALKLATKRNAYDELAFPGMENAIATGRGTWYGLPVIVSNSMVATGSASEQQIALVTQSEVLLADDGSISIDMSSEASVQMNDAPSAGAQSLVSLWQNNLLGIRAEQYINWAPARGSNLGIVLIENTNY